MAVPKHLNELLKSRAKAVAEIHASTDILIQAYKKLIEHDNDIYQILYKPDCLFYDSPIAPQKKEQWLKEHILKNSAHRWQRQRLVIEDGKEKKEPIDLVQRCFTFAGVALDGEGVLKTFMQREEDSLKWINRFANWPDEPEKKRTGIDSIV